MSEEREISFFHPLVPLVVSVIHRRRRLVKGLAVLCFLASFGQTFFARKKGLNRFEPLACHTLISF